MTTAYKKDLGFWVGTYHPAWFAEFVSPSLEAMHWVESETSMTAVVQGANYLVTGYNVPASAGHWDSFGKGLNLLQKAARDCSMRPKVRAKACMLFPRTQYLQLQQEYFNVGASFELFLRAFGELDMLHEDQITDDTLLGYDVLVLFDVDLLPEAVARHIAGFVRNGGTVIADCVPRRNELREPMAVCEELFGVRDAQTGRIARAGHWVEHNRQLGGWELLFCDLPLPTAKIKSIVRVFDPRFDPNTIAYLQICCWVLGDRLSFLGMTDALAQSTTIASKIRFQRFLFLS